MFVNVLVFFGFAFFIGRGLARRFVPKVWARVVRHYEKLGGVLRLKEKPKLDRTLEFFQLFSNSNDYDRDLLYANLERWWKQAPNYKRRRLMQILAVLSKGTPFENFHDISSTNDNQDMDNSSIFEFDINNNNNESSKKETQLPGDHEEKDEFSESESDKE